MVVDIAVVSHNWARAGLVPPISLIPTTPGCPYRMGITYISQNLVSKVSRNTMQAIVLYEQKVPPSKFLSKLISY